MLEQEGLAPVLMQGDPGPELEERNFEPMVITGPIQLGQTEFEQDAEGELGGNGLAREFESSGAENGTKRQYKFTLHKKAEEADLEYVTGKEGSRNQPCICSAGHEEAEQKTGKQAQI